MQMIENIRRIDMFNVGPIFKLKISRTDGSNENIGFLNFTDEGLIKMQALKEFIEVFNLEDKCFLISQ